MLSSTIFYWAPNFMVVIAFEVIMINYRSTDKTSLFFDMLF